MQSLGILATKWLKVLVVSLLIVSSAGVIFPIQSIAQDEVFGDATPAVEVDVPDAPVPVGNISNVFAGQSWYDQIKFFTTCARRFFDLMAPADFRPGAFSSAS